MRVSREHPPDKFIPVIITLETKEEVDAFKRIANRNITVARAIGQSTLLEELVCIEDTYVCNLLCTLSRILKESKI